MEEGPELIQHQIQDSCRLALPEGLKDLMSDISREVLRAQPPDVNTFIADYLSALLITRDSLSIACKICRDICECSCLPQLEEELVYLGLEGSELDNVKSVILKYFEMDEVKESNLFMKLLRDTNIDEDLLQPIQDAVRRAYLRHQMEHSKEYLMPLRASEAVDHTLSIYQRIDDDRNEKATKIQAAYRGYLVRKNQRKPKYIYIKKKSKKYRERPKMSVTSVSSQSLAGSFLCLPRYVPYSAHNLSLNELDEHYSDSLKHYVETAIKDVDLDKHDLDNENKKKIGFLNILHAHDMESCSSKVDDVESDEVSIEEHINEEESIEEYIDEENNDEEDDLSEPKEECDIFDDHQRKTSFSSDLVQVIKSLNEEETCKVYKDFESLMPPYGDLDDAELSKHEIEGDCHHYSDEKHNDDSVPKKTNVNRDSTRTLNNVNRDLSIMIKPVREHIDLNKDDDYDEEDCVQNDNFEIETDADLTEKVVQDKRYSDNYSE